MQLISVMDDLLAEVGLIDTATPGDVHKMAAVNVIRTIKADLMTRRTRGKNGEPDSEVEAETEITEEI